MLRSLLHWVDQPPAPAPRKSTPPPPVMPPPVATERAQPASGSANASEIALPLAPILDGLALELRGKITTVPPPGLTIQLPLDTLLSQLAYGAVKISFGELRRAAPGVFAISGELDTKPVSLPLGEVLPRLNPALLARRAGAKVQVAEDIHGPFGGRGNGVAISTQSLKPTIPAQPGPAAAAMPVAPIAFTPPASFQRASAPAPPTPPARAISPFPNFTQGSTASVPVPAAPPAEPAQPTIHATLKDLAEQWPQELKDEITRAGLASASVPLAGDAVATGLKRGRVTMKWKELRQLARPDSMPSVNDPLELDLPLKLIAPLFLAAQQNWRAKPKTTVSAEIPNLFFGFPQAAPEPVEKKAGDSNFFIWGDEGETPRLEGKTHSPPPVPQTDFTHRYAPPREVVERAAALSGVVGTLVTLPDGLRVAGQVPAEFNADTLAAFVPQLFERMNQSAKELRMGALNNVSFTVGQVPWRIIRVNAVYLAAFGRAGETLPAAELARLAGELDRKKA